MLEEKSTMDSCCLELITEYLSEFEEINWSYKHVSGATYELTDPFGRRSFAYCYVEQYLDTDRYSVFLKERDNLAPVGTVAKKDGVWQSFKA